MLCNRPQPPNYRRLPWKEFASRGDLCQCQVDMKHAALDHRGPVCPSCCPTTRQPQRDRREGRKEGSGGSLETRATTFLILIFVSRSPNFTALHFAAPSIYFFYPFNTLPSTSLPISFSLSHSPALPFPSRFLDLPLAGTGSHNWWGEKKKQTIQPTPQKCEIRLELRSSVTQSNISRLRFQGLITFAGPRHYRVTLFICSHWCRA